MPLFGIGKPNIEKMKIKSDVAGLVKTLEHVGNPEIRREAAEALNTHHGNPKNEKEKSFCLRLMRKEPTVFRLQCLNRK
jgi:hypothetical protein